MTDGNGLTVADALALRNTGDNYYGGFGGGYGGFGGDGWWIIILLLIFANGGWGNGFFGNGGSNPCCTPATAQGVADAFNFSQLDNAVRGLSSDLSSDFGAVNTNFSNVISAIHDSGYQDQLAMATGFGNIMANSNAVGNNIVNSITDNTFQMAQGFCNTNKAISDLGFINQAAFNTLGAQVAAESCDIKRGQEDIKYAVANAANAITIASDKNNDRIIDYLNNAEMEKLRSDLQTANFQISQAAQTESIINQLLPVAKPAYLTCSPYASAFGYNNGCGCGCGA